MNFARRLLAATAAAGLVMGLGVTASAAATQPAFTATIEMVCLAGGDTQTITVQGPAQAAVHIEVSINGSTANGGTQHGTGLANASGTFTDQWAVADVTTATTGFVYIWVVSLDGAAEGIGQFAIHPKSSGACESPSQGTVRGFAIGLTQVTSQVKKTCDAGLSGPATFSVSIKLARGEGAFVSFSLPANANLPLDCNGAAKTLPKLPITSVLTLHEVSGPAGAVAAADTKITVSSTLGMTTIHNAKVAVAATAAAVLPATGTPMGSPTGLPWSALALLGLVLAGVGTRLFLSRR